MLSFCVLAAIVSGAIAANHACYGTIDSLHPTGMRSGGVSASRNAVALHERSLLRMRSSIIAAANALCIEPSVIGGIASRESNFGDSLSNGYGDGGRAWGVMQCDLYTSGDNCKSCGTEDACHFEMMTRHLIRDISAVRARHSSWSTAQILQGAVAAYNFGVSNVQTWGGLDIGTAHNDYSNDVIARAQYLKSHYHYV